MDYRENWTLLSKLHKLWTDKEENKNNTMFKAIYTPVKNFRVKINNEIVDRIKEIVKDERIVDR